MSVSKETVDAGKTEVLMLLLARYIYIRSFDHYSISVNGGKFIEPFIICQDTFRGRVCECPVAKGVQYKGDGYTTCEGIYTLVRYVDSLQSLLVYRT
jgi:hypothetical protein